MMGKNEKLHWRVKKIMEDLPNIDFGNLQDLDVILKAFDVICKLVMTDKAKVASSIFLNELLRDVRINVKLAERSSLKEGDI